MGQSCTSMMATAEENHKVQTLEGVRPGKCLSGHATRSTAVECRYMMPTLARMIAKKPTLKILDVGCGVGSIAVDFALEAPKAEVVGLDLSGSVLEIAKVHAQHKGADNVTFIQGSAHKLPFADRSFDVVHTHQCMAHFANHTMAIEELIRVTKKGGGVLCMREGNLQTARFSSELPLLEECFKLIVAVHDLNGGDTEAGAQLVSWTMDAGIPASSITATQSTCIYNTLEERRDYGGHWPARCTYGVFADLALELGTKR